MATVVDLYQQYNNVTDWAALAQSVSGAYLKYSDGTGGAHVPADTYAAGCRTHGIPWGGYHFAEPGDPVAQAGALIAQYQRLGGKLAPALDLESGGIPAASRVAFARQFLEVVHQTYPVVVLYASASWLASLTPDMWPYSWDRTWCAAYGSNDGTRHTFTAYGGQVDLHQYTSVGRLAGVAGNVDLSYAADVSRLLLSGATPATSRLTDDEETNVQLQPGDHRSLSFAIPAGATKIAINCPIDQLIVHGIWQAGDAFPAGTAFDWKWSHETDFQIDRLRPWNIDVAAGATQGSIIYSYAVNHPERTGNLSFR